MKSLRYWVVGLEETRKKLRTKVSSWVSYTDIVYLALHKRAGRWSEEEHIRKGGYAPGS